MKHTHKYTKLIPSQSMDLINLQCDYKNCKEIKVVDALEYFNPPVTHYAEAHKI